jgi:hypothetical protein
MLEGRLSGKTKALFVALAVTACSSVPDKQQLIDNFTVTYGVSGTGEQRVRENLLLIRHYEKLRNIEHSPAMKSLLDGVITALHDPTFCRDSFDFDRPDPPSACVLIKASPK